MPPDRLSGAWFRIGGGMMGKDEGEEKAKIFFLLFLDEKKQKSSDCTEFRLKYLITAKIFQFRPN